MNKLSDIILSNLMIAICCSIIAVVISWIALVTGYYELPNKNAKGPQITLLNVISLFLILIITYMFLAPIILRILTSIEFFTIHQNSILPLFQILIFLTVAIFITIYTIFQKMSTMKRVWKDWSVPESKPYSYDIAQGLLTWIIAIPAVIAAAHLSEAISIILFNPSDKEQLAIRYLKIAMQSPYSLFMAAIAIVIAAPVLEEYMFRGILQSWLRNKFGSVIAIFSSATLFAFFHYSPSQGPMNFPLITSLFVFACYLGFIYEKTRSLYSSIVLHVTFNLISVMRIIFVGI